MPIPNESCMPVQKEIYRSIQDSFSVNHTTKKGAHTDLKASAFLPKLAQKRACLPMEKNLPKKSLVAALGEKE